MDVLSTRVFFLSGVKEGLAVHYSSLGKVASSHELIYFHSCQGSGKSDEAESEGVALRSCTTKAK